MVHLLSILTVLVTIAACSAAALDTSAQAADIAMIETLAAKYNCETNGVHIVQVLEETKLKNNKASENLTTTCNEAYTKYDEQLLRQTKYAKGIELNAKPDAQKIYDDNVEIVNGDYDAEEKIHDDTVKKARDALNIANGELKEATKTFNKETAEENATTTLTSSLKSERTVLHNSRILGIQTRQGERISAAKLERQNRQTTSSLQFKKTTLDCNTVHNTTKSRVQHDLSKMHEIQDARRQIEALTGSGASLLEIQSSSSNKRLGKSNLRRANAAMAKADIASSSSSSTSTSSYAELRMRMISTARAGTMELLRQQQVQDFDVLLQENRQALTQWQAECARELLQMDDDLNSEQRKALNLEAEKPIQREKEQTTKIQAADNAYELVRTPHDSDVAQSHQDALETKRSQALARAAHVRQENSRLKSTKLVDENKESARLTFNFNMAELKKREKEAILKSNNQKKRHDNRTRSIHQVDKNKCISTKRRHQQLIDQDETQMNAIEKLMKKLKLCDIEHVTTPTTTVAPTTVAPTTVAPTTIAPTTTVQQTWTKGSAGSGSNNLLQSGLEQRYKILSGNVNFCVGTGVQQLTFSVT